MPMATMPVEHPPSVSAWDVLPFQRVMQNSKEHHNEVERVEYHPLHLFFA